jgi:hypothetical protein
MAQPSLVSGIRDVPTRSQELVLDGMRWQLGPLGTDERTVPADVFNRVRALEAAGVPFGYWLWGEELAQRPNLRPLPKPTPAVTWIVLMEGDQRACPRRWHWSRAPGSHYR